MDKKNTPPTPPQPIPIDIRNAPRRAEAPQGLGVGEPGDPCPTLTTGFTPGVATSSLPSARHVKTLAKQAEAPGSPANDPLCSLRQPALFDSSSLSIFAGKMLQVPIAQITARTLRQRCAALPVSGIARPGPVSMLNGSASRNVVVVCFSSAAVMESPRTPIFSTLLDVLQKNAPSKYRLSKTAAAGILRRAEKRSKKLPELLARALALVAGAET